MTFAFERSSDWALIKSIMTHPRIYPHITDDFAVPAAEFEPVRSAELLYVVVRERDQALGLFLLEPRGGVQAEVHTCLMPAGWIRDSRAIATQAMVWLWENCPQVERLTTTVPRNNSLPYVLHRLSAW